MKISIQVPKVDKRWAFIAGASGGIGAAFNSIVTKLTATHISAFLSPELMTEAHQKWYCIASPSYSTDALILFISLLLLFLFTKEVMKDETHDSGGQV